jgi:DNA-binding MarR family transcriptional regulator
VGKKKQPSRSAARPQSTVGSARGAVFSKRAALGPAGAAKTGAANEPWAANLAPAFEGVKPSPDANVPFRSVGFTVSTTGYAIARRFREILAPLELEPRDFALLRAVGAAEGSSQQALGERMRILPSRMVAFIDALEQRGLVERRHNPEDRRTRELYLTDDGRSLIDRAFALAVGHERDLCAELNHEEREQLLDLLQRVGLRLGLQAEQGHAALTDE